MNFKSILLLGAALFALMLPAGGAAACTYSGERGYDNPRGSQCKGSYTFTARHQFIGGVDYVTFRSDGRKWFWEGVGGAYTLERLSPRTRSAMSGEVQTTGSGMSGWLKSGFCGRGWIELTARPGSC